MTFLSIGYWAALSWPLGVWWGMMGGGGSNEHIKILCDDIAKKARNGRAKACGT